MTDRPSFCFRPSGSGLARSVGVCCGLSLMLALGGGPRALIGQEDGSAPPPALRERGSAALLDTGSAVLSPEAAYLFRGGWDGADALSSPTGPGERAGPMPLFPKVSTLERGWRLVAGRAADAAPGPDGDWRPSHGARSSGNGEEPGFLVELFDARDVVAWIREAKAWGMDARRTLFGPRGLVRAGSVPGSDRPRIRVQLTDSRPGLQVVILTR